MHVKISLAQVQEQHNLSISYVRFGKKNTNEYQYQKSTNVNLAEGNLQVDRILCISTLKSKRMSLTLEIMRNILAVFQINEIFAYKSKTFS